MLAKPEKISALGAQILDLVDEGLRRKRLSARQASILAVGNDGLIRDLRAGRMPGIDRLKALFDVLGLELHLGLPGALDSGPPPPSASQDDFAHIPLHDAFLAAGGGTENGAEAVIDYLAFRRDWLRRIGVAPSNAALARVEGDSMQPSIWHGDMVMIDHSVARQTIPVRARSGESKVRSPVYALLEDGKARVKRIERPLEDQLILISDNPDYAPQIVHPRDVTVIGKVIWWGHTAKE